MCTTRPTAGGDRVAQTPLPAASEIIVVNDGSTAGRGSLDGIAPVDGCCRCARGREWRQGSAPVSASPCARTIVRDSSSISSWTRCNGRPVQPSSRRSGRVYASRFLAAVLGPVDLHRSKRSLKGSDNVLFRGNLTDGNSTDRRPRRKQPPARVEPIRIERRSQRAAAPRVRILERPSPLTKEPPAVKDRMARGVPRSLRC